MPKQTYPRDRFDEVPAQPGRVGAHRAENPHLHGWVVFLWAAAATVVLVAAGVFGTLVASGRITLVAEEKPTPTPTPTVTAVVDTSYSVLVLNATPVEGLAGQITDKIVSAGWAPADVSGGGAGSTDFERTTVYYAYPEDKSAAAGLAKVIGGADLEESDQYLPPNDPDALWLTVVIGLDRVAKPTPTPTP